MNPQPLSPKQQPGKNETDDNVVKTSNFISNPCVASKRCKCSPLSLFLGCGLKCFSLSQLVLLVCFTLTLVSLGLSWLDIDNVVVSQTVPFSNYERTATLPHKLYELDSLDRNLKIRMVTLYAYYLVFLFLLVLVVNPARGLFTRKLASTRKQRKSSSSSSSCPTNKSPRCSPFWYRAQICFTIFAFLLQLLFFVLMVVAMRDFRGQYEMLIEKPLRLVLGPGFHLFLIQFGLLFAAMALYALGFLGRRIKKTRAELDPIDAQAIANPDSLHHPSPLS